VESTVSTVTFQSLRANDAIAELLSLLTISAQVTGTKLQVGARIQLKVVYTDNTLGKLNLAVPAGTYGFTEIAGSLPLTKPVKSVVVMLDMKRLAGRVRVDKLWLSNGGPDTRSGSVLSLPVPATVPNSFRGSN
jgi:hypothetical protein